MIGRSLSTATALFAAFIASQAPEFAQQYRQRLGGAVDELSNVVASFDQDATAAGLTRSAAVDRMVSNKDELIRLRGISMEAALSRYARLRQQLDQFESQGTFGRVAALATTPDAPLLQATLDHYEPAVPTTAGGIVIAVLGGMAGWLAMGFLRLGLLPLSHWRRRRREEQPY